MAPSLILNRRPQVPAEETAAFGPIAERFRRAGDLERAATLCREGLKRFPQHISARVTLGWALLDLGKYDEARTELEMVLRRAPDNLAAIRGLAELHDRAEHTMHLPMDGPGQWPPDEAAVNQAAEPGAPEAAVIIASDFATLDNLSAEFAVADLAEAEPTPVEIDSGPAVFTAAAYESPVRAPEPEPEPAVEQPVAEAVAEAPVPEPVAAESEPFEAGVGEEPAAVAAAAETAASDEQAPSTAVAAAAETETEDDAAPWHADVMDQRPEPVVETVAAENHETAAVEEPAAAWAAPIEALQAVAELEAAALPEAAPVEEAIDTPVVSEDDIAALIAEAERLEAEADAAVAAAALELDADAGLDLLDDLGLGLAPDAAEAPAPEAALADSEPVPETEAALQPEAVRESEPAMAAAAVGEEVEHVARQHVAEVVLLARAAHPGPAQVRVEALERFLRKVQARRAQVMTQSVA